MRAPPSSLFWLSALLDIALGERLPGACGAPPATRQVDADATAAVPGAILGGLADPRSGWRRRRGRLRLDLGRSTGVHRRVRSVRDVRDIGIRIRPGVDVDAGDRDGLRARARLRRGRTTGCYQKRGGDQKGWKFGHSSRYNAASPID